MNKLQLFSCGHATTNLETECCPRCGDSNQIKFLTSLVDGLHNRKAKNVQTKKIVKSRWDLPNFRYCSNQEYDIWR